VPVTNFKGRHAVELENDFLRLTVLQEGGHIAQVFDKQANISPLWIPHWPSSEPSSYDPKKHSEFGTGSDAKLLTGIMGHNVCLDIFGGPSAEEAAAGFTAHGEGSVNRYELVETFGQLVMQLHLPLAQLSFKRTIQLYGRNVRVQEVVENLTAVDRPIAWTQHVTLGPPFLRPKTTQFRASMARSIVSETDPGENAYLAKGAEFEWPMAPRSDSGMSDLRQMNPIAPASAYTAHLADPLREDAFFIAFEPEYQLAFGYIWKRADFPWLGIWEENRSRRNSPWNSKTITRGMEFGVSPFPEPRREMVDRGSTLGAPGCRWLPCRGRVHAEYWISTQIVGRIPESLSWPEVSTSDAEWDPRHDIADGV
jgi:hypothetical protein